MKKAIVILCGVLCLCAVSSYAGDFGFGIDVGINDWRRTGAEPLEDFSITIRPSLLFNLSELIELNPFLSIGYNLDSDPTDYDPNVAYDMRYFSFGGGANLLFHFIRSEYVDLSTGLQLAAYFNTTPLGTPVYTSYFYMRTFLNITIALDIKFTKNLLMRVSTEIAGLYMQLLSWDTGAGVMTDNRFFAFTYDQRSLHYVNVRFGFFFLL